MLQSNIETTAVDLLLQLIVAATLAVQRWCWRIYGSCSTTPWQLPVINSAITNSLVTGARADSA